MSDVNVAMLAHRTHHSTYEGKSPVAVADVLHRAARAELERRLLQQARPIKTPKEVA